MYVKLAPVLLVMVGLLSGAAAPPGLGRLALYDDVGQRTLLGEITVMGCVSFESWQNDKVSSVNTNNNCFELFEDYNCKGRSVKFGPSGVNGCPDHNSLFSCNFNDLASSVRAC